MVFEDAHHEDQPKADQRIDPWLLPAGPALVGIADHAFEIIESLKPPGSRRPRSDALARRRRILHNLIANLALVTLCQPEGCRIAVATRNEALTRYDRPDFPPQVLTSVVSALGLSGLVTLTRGAWKGRRTTIAPSIELRRQLLGAISLADIGREVGGETVILTVHHDATDRHKELLNYSDTCETHRLRAEMAAINAGLNAAKITIIGQGQPPIHLTRRFQVYTATSDPAFDQHGRIYDGFWINMPRQNRHLIRINGEVVADLDFTGMFTQLAYLHAGLPLPVGDPYGGVEGLEADPEAPPEANARKREAIKRGLNAFYFRSGKMLRLPSEVKVRLGAGWNATRFARAIRQRHAPIKHLFGTGLGIRFMYTESCILVRTLLDLADLGVVALPVHDGIMVPVSKQQIALEAMQAASRAIVGVPLPVKAKVLLPPHQH